MRGSTLPWEGLRRSAHHFWRQMHAARRSADRHEDLPEDTYALATQVFAAMAVEAQLNTYGLARFGETAFEDFFRWLGPVKRLRQMAKWAGVSLDASDERALFPPLQSLMDKRDPIVHMQANEEVFDQEGKVIRSAPPPPDWLAGAEAAMQEMETFLRAFSVLINRHDPENRGSIAPLDTPGGWPHI